MKNIDWKLFFNKYKYIIIGIIIFIILLIIIFSRKKNKYIYAPIPKDVINEPLTEDETVKIQFITNNLYNELKGASFFFIWRDEKPFEEFLELSDKLFVAVYNNFNHLYYTKNTGTLRQWLKDDLFYKGSKAWAAYVNIFNRMDKLNLA